MNNYFLRSIPKTLKAIIGFRVPLRVTQYITYRCNLNCRYCARHEARGMELSTEEVKSLMAAFRKAGTLFWGFNGGEPLIRDDIGDLIDFGKRIGLFTSITTNGTLLMSRYGEIRNVDVVNISFEGRKDIHDELRPRSYDQLCEGVTALSKEGMNFTFSACINNLNADSLGFILDFAEKYKTKAFFQPIRVQNEDEAAKSRGFFPTQDKMRKAINYLLSEKGKGRPVATSESFLQQIKASWPDAQASTRCWAGRLFCSITPEGVVTACCDTLNESRKRATAWSPQEAVRDFFHLPVYRCATCYAAIPREANIALSMCLKNPVSSVRQVASFLPRRHWRSRG
jgi:MoaA/NifB/PqqE/SkfB family radical SAM enzyme